MNIVVVVAMLALSSSVLARHRYDEPNDSGDFTNYDYEFDADDTSFKRPCTHCDMSCFLRRKGKGKCVNDECVCEPENKSAIERKKGGRGLKLCIVTCFVSCLFQGSLGSCIGSTCICGPQRSDAPHRLLH